MNDLLTYDYESMRMLSLNIRAESVKMIAHAGSGHIGGTASVADVLAVLYGGVLKHDPLRPDWEERDWLILSKGHCGPALYAALALRGYFPMDWLKTLNKPGTDLPSHADRNHTPGVDMSTGSLGQGISAAAGIALANRILGRDSYVYCIVGDGELNEGEVWEACETAAHLKLDRFIVFVDWNKKQLDGRLESICNPGDLSAKFAAFGWIPETVKGYDVREITEAIVRAKQTCGKPHVILLDTVKGLGVDFAEAAEKNHHMAFTMSAAEDAIAEMKRRYENGSYPAKL